MATEQSNGKMVVGVTLRAATVARLDELAAEGEVKRAGLIADLLEELVPKIASVERRTAIKLKPGEGRP